MCARQPKIFFSYLSVGFVLWLIILKSTRFGHKSLGWAVIGSRKKIVFCSADQYWLSNKEVLSSIGLTLRKSLMSCRHLFLLHYSRLHVECVHVTNVMRMVAVHCLLIRLGTVLLLSKRQAHSPDQDSNPRTWDSDSFFALQLCLPHRIGPFSSLQAGGAPSSGPYSGAPPCSRHQQSAWNIVPNFPESAHSD